MNYDEIAEWYDASVRGGLPMHALTLPAIAELAGDVAGRYVCDLCCGQGIAARELARRGAHVTGVDLSERLLAIARQEEAARAEEWPGSVVYRYGDALALEGIVGIETGLFEGVICCMALMDLPDLPAALRNVARVLTPGGWFVFAITHPCFQTPDSRWTGKAGGTVRREVRGYFREGHWVSSNTHGVRGKAGAYHRTLSTLVNALMEADFMVMGMREPQALDDLAGRVPGYGEVPMALIARCEKRGARSS